MLCVRRMETPGVVLEYCLHRPMILRSLYNSKFLRCCEELNSAEDQITLQLNWMALCFFLRCLEV